MADNGVWPAVIAGVTSFGAAIGAVLYRTRASRLESFGKYQVGLRVAYREFLLAVDQLDPDTTDIPTDKLEYLRDRYYRVYFGGDKDVETALEEFWPARNRRAGTLPKEGRPAAKKKLVEAMAKYTRP